MTDIVERPPSDWYERWQDECTKDHGEYPDDQGVEKRLRWWRPKSAKHGSLTLEDDLIVGADEIERLRAELSKCGRENCMGLRVDGVRSWVTLDAHEALRADYDAACALLAQSNAERDASNRAAAWCDKHKPNGGVRARCVICSGEALSAALSRISYLCGEPNEMECGPYDVYCDEDAVVEQIKGLVAERDALRADAERYRWLRDRSAANPRDFYSHEDRWYVSRTFGNGYGENYTGNRMDAAIDAAMAAPKG